jgi:tetratricopeptide (TPR) repeat protein
MDSKKLSYLLVFLIPLIVYSPTLTGTFYYDDNVIFFGHQVKVLADNPFSVFKGETHYLPGAPRSIHVFSLLMIYKLFGTSPFPYHLFNLLIHCLTTLFVFIFLKRIIPEKDSSEKKALPAFIGALIFGLHPVHLENITFVTLGGTDLFYTFWAMLSLLSYIWFRDQSLKGTKNLILLALSVFAFLLSVMSKESAVAFILIYPMTELLLRKKGFLWALPHAAVLVAYKWNFIFGTVPSAVGRVVSPDGNSMGVEGVFKSIGFFMKSLVFPYPHSPLIKEFPSETILYPFAVLIGIIIILSVIARKRLFAYSALWFLIISVPYLYVPLATANIAITAERYIYAPSIALSIFIAGAMTGIFKKPRAGRLILPLFLLLLLAYSVLDVSYFFKVWRTEKTFWEQVIRTNPDYVTGYISLASIAMDENNFEKAQYLLMEGLRKPKGMPAEFAQAAYSLGNIALKSGNRTRAESYFLLSLKYAPYEFSFIQLGFLYLETGNLNRAKWAFENAMRFPRQNIRAVYGLAKTLSLLGQKEKARQYAMRVYKSARDERLRALAMEIIRNSR